MRRGVFTERRTATAGDADSVAVDDAVSRLLAEGLPASRSTLFRQAQVSAQWAPLFAIYDEHGRLWLTQKGLAEVRQQLMSKALTKLQTMLSKGKEAARKFTARHKLYIQEATTRGDKLDDIARALHLPMGRMLCPEQERDSDT